MFALIVTIILVIAILVSPKIVRLAQTHADTEENLKKQDKFVRKSALLASVIIALIAWSLQTIKIIPTGEVGIKTAFGVVSGRAKEGFNLIAPWEDIIPMNIKIQKQSFSDLSASTKDSQMITNIDIDVNYKLSSDKAEELYASTGQNYQEILMSPILTQLIKDRLALYNAENLVSERNKIVADLTEQLRENLQSYGVDILEVSLINYDFSPEFTAALERKAVAAKDIETANNEQEKAKIEAETNKIKTQQLTEAVLMEKLIDAIKNGQGTYIIDTSNLSISIK